MALSSLLRTGSRRGGPSIPIAPAELAARTRMLANTAACPTPWFLRFFVSMAGPFPSPRQGRRHAVCCAVTTIGLREEEVLGDLWSFSGVFLGNDSPLGPLRSGGR